MTIKQMRWYKHHPTEYHIEVPEYGRLAVTPGIPDEVSISVSIVNFRNSPGSEVLIVLAVRS